MSEQNTPPQNPNMASSNNIEDIEDIDMVDSPKDMTQATKSPENYDSFSDEIDDDASIHIVQKEDELTAEAQSSDISKIRIQGLEEKLERMKDQMVRALADAENTRKRAIKERQDATKYAISNFARDIISVADNLRRALESIPAETIEEFPQVKILTQGIEATQRELLRCFEKNGIGKLEPLGHKFDPNFHEVMFETSAPEKENGTIIQVIEPGYIINGRILRPARVGVAKNSETPLPPEGTGSGYNIDTEA
jgi:molecular chaperone GrpE